MNNYASLQETHDHDEQSIVFESDLTRSQWTHIDNLDRFFQRIYVYHQEHGFFCMLLHELLNIHQFIFVVCFSTYLIFGIDYNKLFNSTVGPNRTTIIDVMLPVSECIDRFTFLAWLLLIFALATLLIKTAIKFYNLYHYWDIKQFYNTALKIPDAELDNLTWFDVQSKLKHAQLEHQMCIHKRELTNLDIYHRILRQENYFVAMVNKRLFPPRIRLKFLGDCVYWTKGFRFNMNLLLFTSVWSPFENAWHLREEYKRQGMRHELARNMGNRIIILAVINLLLSPSIVIWQILLYFFNYFELVRREPGKFGVRYWSPYAQVYLRHFNELDHELRARLTRACRPAAKYLAAFSSPIVTIIAEHFAFLCSSILGVFLILSIYDNEVIYIEQVLTLVAFLTGVIAISRSFVPDEMTVWCPETLLDAVVLHTHYLQSDWRGKAHTSQVRHEFQQLYQYRFASLLEELLSPLVTPFFLLTYVYPRSLEIVDFFRNFTVSVVGVGDVCSFAQMDIRKHGNPEWHAEGSNVVTANNQYLQGEDGKIELSLVHFTAMNPDWVPPEDARDFVNSVNEETEQMLVNEREGNFMDSIQNFMGSSEMLDLDLPSAIAYREASRTNFGLPSSRTQPGYDSLPRMSLAMSHRLGRSVTFATQAEGPADVPQDAMRSSIFVLHNRRRQSTMPTRSLEETTPLLSEK